MKKQVIYVSLIAIIYAIIVSYIIGLRFSGVLLASFLIFFAYFKNIKNFDRNNFIIYSLIFLVDLVLVIYNSKYRNLPFTNIDWHNFDNFAKNLLLSSNGNIFKIFINAIDLFTALVTIIYKFFGTNITMIYFYILPFSFILSNYLYKIVYKITNDVKIAQRYSLIILLYPANFIFSLSVLREIPIQCLTIMSFYYFLSYLKDDKMTNLIKSLVFIFLATLMHSGMIGILIIYVYIIVQKKFYNEYKIFRPWILFITAVLMFGLSFTSLWQPITKRFINIDSTSDVLKTVNYQNDYLIANTQYINNNSSSFFELILTVPYRMIMFSMSPFPWQIFNFSTLLSLLLDGVFRYYIVINCIIIFKNRHKFEHESKNIILIIALILIISDFLFGLGCNNYGQAMRHRTKLLSFELILLSMKKRKDIYEK